MGWRSAGVATAATGATHNDDGGCVAAAWVDEPPSTHQPAAGGRVVAALECHFRTFAAGAGESNPWLRSRILEGLGEFGIVLDEKRNAAAVRTEACISAPDSRVAVWVVPTDEEIVVARHAAALLEKTLRS